MDNLAETLAWAEAEGNPVPPEHIAEKARYLLRKLNSTPYTAYPMPDGAIALDARGGGADGALIVLNLDDTVCYSGEINGVSWHREYSIVDLSRPETLKELREWNTNTATTDRPTE